MRPAVALALLAALAAAALLAQHVAGAAFVALLLFAVCLRAPTERRRLYLVGTLLSAGGLFVLTPFIETMYIPLTMPASSAELRGVTPATRGNR